MRKDVLAGVGVGAALLGGAALYFFREKSTEEPDYRALESEGDHQIRDYPALTVAETVVEGSRRDALDQASHPRRYLARPLSGVTARIPCRWHGDGGDQWAAILPFRRCLEGPDGARGSSCREHR